jgi:hypothetical protein
MSEDEQCGRWETTPEDLKAKIRVLKAALNKIITNTDVGAASRYVAQMALDDVARMP